MKNKTKNSFIILHFTFLILNLLLLSCTKPNPKNPFDPETQITLQPLQIIQISDSQVELQWQLNADIVDHYRIERKIDSGNYSFHATVNANTSDYIDDSLSIENIYYYKVFGVNDENITEPISNSIRTTFAEITNFNIQHENLFTAKLTWQHDCNYEEGYIIERMETGKGERGKRRKGEGEKRGKEKVKSKKEKVKRETTDDFIEIANLPANETSFTDSTLLPNYIYEYRIHSYTTWNESNYSSQTFDNIFPKPTNLIITQDNVHTFSLIWNDNSNGEQGFNIERKIDDEAYMLIHTNAENDTTFTDDINTREQFETVYYKIYAFFEDIYSNSLIGSCSIGFSAPTNLQYQHLTISSIGLTWDDNSNGEDGFKIDKKVGTNTWQNEFSTVTENIEEWTDENAEINEILQYRVYAFSGNNNSTSIETGEIDNAIQVPENLSYIIIDISSIELHWQYNTVGIDSFVIARKAGENNWNNNFASIPYDELQWTDDNLELEEWYYYKVRAKYENYYSEFSNEVEYSSNFVIVDVNGSGDYLTIQEGINAAEAGNTVLVHPGTYVENINYNGKNITVASLFLTSQDTTYISQTIIDGNQNGSVVTFVSCEDSTAVLSGFTITNGNYDYGGGIICDNSSPIISFCIISYNTGWYGGGCSFDNNSIPTIENCTITFNSAGGTGAGIKCNSSSPLIISCTISNNTSVGTSEGWGGGIRCSNISNPIIENCFIENNEANFGGGINCFDNSSPTVTNCSIIGNTASTGGGGIWCEESSPTIMNCEISNNTVTEEFDGGSGGGIKCYNNSSPMITDCIIDSNTSNQYGGGITCYLNSSPTITNCSITNNEANDIGGGVRITDNSSPSLENCIINGNSSSYGGGISCDSSSPTISECIISNNIANNYHGGGIYFSSSSAPSITNCTISNNIAMGTSAGSGGGIYIWDSSPTITNCTISDNSSTGGYGFGGGICFQNSTLASVVNCSITNNSAVEDGGGIVFRSSSAEINDCTINGNTSNTNGGGIYCDDSSPTISNCTISENTALGEIPGSSSGGGGIYFFSSSPTITNCIINGNTASDDGGGMNFYQSHPMIINSLITNNTSGNTGGGIRCDYSSPTITNCTMSGNMTGDVGGAIYCKNTSSPIVHNSICWADSSDYGSDEIGIYPGSFINITYSDIEGSWTGEGNIDDYPLFIDPENGDFHLQEGSPCIDAGNPDPQYNDPDGTRNDMGAYYFDQSLLE